MLPVRLAAAPGSERVLAPYVGSDRSTHYIETFNLVTFVHVRNVTQACDLVLACLPLELIGCDLNDFPVPAAEMGRDYYTIRLNVAVKGTRADAHNQATSRFIRSLPYRVGMKKKIMPNSGRRAVQLHFPTPYGAKALAQACPHLRLVKDKPYRPER